MRRTWTRDFLMKRIDRCYLIAAWTKDRVKRITYLKRARHYRALLASMVLQELNPQRAAA